MCKIKIEVEMPEKPKATILVKKKTVKKAFAEQARVREPVSRKKRKVVIMNNKKVFL